MIDSCRVFTYSPQNKYAADYYYACRKFDNIQDEIIKYENKTSDRNEVEYEKLMAEFKYWNKEVPRRSDIAGREEDRIKDEQAQENGVGNRLNIVG